MNDTYPPAVPIPDELTDQAAAQLLEFLYELARVLETHYAGQLHRYYARPDDDQFEPWSDPPF